MSEINNCVEEIYKNGFESKIGKNVAVVDFFAEWCMPCLMMSPVMEELADKFRGKIHFCKVNIDDNSELVQKHKVLSVPTLIVFKEGKEVERITGSQSPDLIEEKLKKHL